VVDVAERSGSPRRSPETTQEGMTARRVAIRSAVLGILALVIQLLAWGDWFIRETHHDAAFWRFVAGLGPNPESPDSRGS
jgi:hypothetical protein